MSLLFYLYSFIYANLVPYGYCNPHSESFPSPVPPSPLFPSVSAAIALTMSSATGWISPRLQGLGKYLLKKTCCPLSELTTYLINLDY